MALFLRPTMLQRNINAAVQYETLMPRAPALGRRSAGAVRRRQNLRSTRSALSKISSTWSRSATSGGATMPQSPVNFTCRPAS
jgi:hypothetical protein